MDIAELNPFADAEEKDDRSEKEKHDARVFDLKKSAAGGLVAAILALGTKLAIGGIGPWEAQRLLENTLPTTRFLCSGVMTASATILALLLTMISMTASADAKLDKNHFIRVKMLARVTTVSFIVAAVFLTLLVMPLGGDGSNVPVAWYQVIYYAMVLINAILGGLTVTIVLMLYSTISDVVDVIGLGKDDHPMAAQQE